MQAMVARFCALALAFLLSSVVLGQEVGIWQSYVVLEEDSSGLQFFAGGMNADGAMEIDTVVFVKDGLDKLWLRGGEIKSFKNGSGDVTGAYLHYRITPQGALAGNFVEIPLPFFEDLPNAGDQKWQAVDQEISLFDSLTPGNYDFELYWRITTNQGDVFDNNNGNNYLTALGLPAVSTPENLSLVVPQVAVYPNPSNGDVTIQWDLLKPEGAVEITLFDAAGRVVKVHRSSVVNGRWQPAGLAPGNYTVMLQADEALFQKRIVVVR